MPGKTPIPASAPCAMASRRVDRLPREPGSAQLISARTPRLVRRRARIVVGRRFHRALWSAFGDGNERRSQNALADHVTGLYHPRHRAGGPGGIGQLEHRLMDIWIEFLAQRLEFLDSVLFQHFQEFALRELDTLQ